ncbi:hypothetical protein GCM10009092_23750 [Bowmanella denitrificans]|uniref:DUF4440 domain-containing protein n=1 Tax=Bowmanella denitrificans TaxID=366582 RepID=A0ABN0X9S4_9ALTE
MFRRLTGVLLACLVCMLSVEVEAADEQSEIKALLDDFLIGASENNPAAHNKFWAEDLVYTSSAGERFGKAELMAELDQEKQNSERVDYSAQGVNIRLYGNVAVVTFKLVGHQNNQYRYYLNSGTLVKRFGQWQAVNWQATHASSSS